MSVPITSLPVVRRAAKQERLGGEEKQKNRKRSASLDLKKPSGDDDLSEHLWFTLRLFPNVTVYLFLPGSEEMSSVTFSLGL